MRTPSPRMQMMCLTAALAVGGIVPTLIVMAITPV